MSGTSLATKGMICRGGNLQIDGGAGGYHEREIQIEKPKINIINVKTTVARNGVNLAEFENIKFEIKKIITTY
jgi:hypothetical protein